MDNGRLSVLCTELSEILRSGITPAEGFLIISEQETDGRLRPAYESLCRQLMDGSSVGAAMRGAGVFPEYMLRMISIAEQTGALEKMLRELSEYYERQERLRRTIRSTVSYPLLLSVVVLAVFLVFLTEVLPVFDKVFGQIGADMLPAAVVFLNIGLWLAKAKWWIIGMVSALAAAAITIRLVPSVNGKISAAAGRMFSGTKTGRKISASRLANVISLAVSGASDINEALELSGEFASGFERDERLEKCRKLVMDGSSFAESAQKSGLFEPVYCRMLYIGERSGSTETIMRDIARRSEEDMEAALDRLTGRIEPIAVTVLSLFVGLLLLSVMLPLVGIMSAL